MQTSSIRRQMKNVVNNYTEAEIKVREATSNDPWGASGSLMAEIADLTYNMIAFAEVMGMIWRRLNDHGKNWRHVYKALGLMDYLVKTGSERVAQECRDNIHSIQTLKDFQYIDRDGQDQGQHIREKAKRLVALLKDTEKLKKERSEALKTKSRMVGVQYYYGELPPPYPGGHTSHYRTYPSRSSPSQHSTSYSPRLTPELEQARPTTSGEEELQLQLALAMSREESENPDENSQLQMNPSKKVNKPAKPTAATMDMDEDTQLKLAMNMSKEAHEQEKLSRQGDESMLQKALEESKREMASKGGTAFMDLVDVFAVPSDPPPSDHTWNKTSYQASIRTGGSDPWDPLDGSRSSSRVDSPWMVPPASNSPPPPWKPSPPSGNPWDAPQSIASNLWGVSTNTASAAVDPFRLPVDKTSGEPLRAGSPSDGDLFDEAMDGGQLNVNGQREDSPELYDFSQLKQSLVEPTPRALHTPEAFLGTSGASLVNLDTLIPSNPATMNPFLSDGAAPTTSNPFQVDQARLTLDQMGSTTLQGALPYSASLPLPISHQPASLPSSFTHPSQPGFDLPEPLLPLSTGSAQVSQAALNNQNPFL
ncbi:epsin-3 isoform X1 [Dunckerocampus dactyliophorus]|uniref:epsin-3 isoform X1 n=1 Tax=Dunckerocampus dactyliophorus TaxID=161453 RepID=UPI002405347E|nr:epsin-3 isoform X1 [Dunckerocampus dactyliophorus]